MLIEEFSEFSQLKVLITTYVKAAYIPADKHELEKTKLKKIE